MPSGITLNSEFNLRVYFHAIRKANGSGGPTLSEINQSLNILNQSFNPEGIFFIWDGCLNEVTRQDIYDSQNPPPENILDENPHTNGIDIYIAGDDTYFPVGDAFGVGYRSGFIIGGLHDITNTFWARSPVIVHEMGHVLNLFHTHTTANFSDGSGGRKNVTRDIQDPC